MSDIISQRLNQAFQRIKAIGEDWDYYKPRCYSHRALLREYFHRTALWTGALKSDQWLMYDVGSGLPQPSIIPDEFKQQLDAGVWAVKAVVDFFGGTLDRPRQFQDSLRATRFMRKATWNSIKIVSSYLRWSIVAPEVEAEYGLPNPYEPIIRLFERGGQLFQVGGLEGVVLNVDDHMGYHSGEIYEDGWQHFATIPPLQSMEITYLNQIDEDNLIWKASNLTKLVESLKIPFNKKEHIQKFVITIEASPLFIRSIEENYVFNLYFNLINLLSWTTKQHKLQQSIDIRVHNNGASIQNELTIRCIDLLPEPLIKIINTSEYHEYIRIPKAVLKLHDSNLHTEVTDNSITYSFELPIWVDEA